jgi:hypothetical protein
MAWMRKVTRAVILALGVALGAAACDPDVVPTDTGTSTSPSPTITESFTGSITLNGAVSYFFSTNAAGLLTATIRTLTPDSTMQLGLALGTWNGNCNTTISNERAGQGITVTGSVSGSGNLCVRIFDANGTVITPSQFEIVVVHP